MQNLVCCLIFFSVFRGIKGDIIKGEQAHNAVKPQQFWNEYNFVESADEAVIAEEDDESEDNEDFNDNKLGKSSVENSNVYKDILEARGKETESNETLLQRKSRDRRNDAEKIECLQCYASNQRVNVSLDDENCYSGINVTSVVCGSDNTRSNTECFTELHPLYIKRGCYQPVNLNVTFHCKCTLCNDKPADKREFFTYDNEKDWSFDNKRLQQPNLPGVTAACKYCNASRAGFYGTCLDGTNVEYTICDEGQVCYTKINRSNGTLSRGCADKPAYNSLFVYCNRSNCNNKNYWSSNVAFQFVQLRNKVNLTFVPASESNGMLETSRIVICVSLISLYANTL